MAKNPFNNLISQSEKDVLKCALEISRTMHSRMYNSEDDRIPSDASRRYEHGKAAGKILAYANVTEHTLMAMLLMMGE